MLKRWVEPFTRSVGRLFDQPHAIFATKVKSSLAMSEVGHEEACLATYLHVSSSSNSRQIPGARMRHEAREG